MKNFKGILRVEEFEIEESDCDFGEIFTISEFKQHLVCNNFNDHDGFAYVCEENGEELFPISCEEIAKLDLKNTAITHIRWYNK